jgi:hypothetical protein
VDLNHSPLPYQVDRGRIALALGVEETSLTVRSCGRVGELVVTQLITQRDSLVGSRAFKRSVVDVRGAVAEGSCCRPLAYLTQVSPC